LRAVDAKSVADSAHRFALIGNRIALDFANTIHARRQNCDAIQTPDDVFDFLRATGMRPGLAEKKFDAGTRAEFFDQAIRLRSALRAWLDAGAKPPDRQTNLIRCINGILAANTGKLILRREVKGWGLTQVAHPRSLLTVLAPVAESAAELIVEGRGAPIRKCGNPRCPMYFYDTSRTGTRRWCSMDSCGNHAKVRSFLQRRRENRAAA